MLWTVTEVESYHDDRTVSSYDFMELFIREKLLFFCENERMIPMKKISALLLMVLLVLTLSACNTPAPAAPQPQVKTLRVAMECGYAPYNWSQENDANGAVAIADSKNFANGYDVSMAKLIAEAGGYQLQIVRLDWDSLIPALQSGEVDAVIAGQSITAERLEQVDFSDPYYYASIVTLTNKDSVYADAKGLADLAGGTATSQLGTVWYDVCLPQIENANILPAQESAPSMLVALNSKAVDYVVCDLPTAMAAVQVNENLVILDFTGTEDDFEVSEEEVNLGISVKKGNTQLLEVINGVLSELTVDDFEEMMDAAIAIQPLSE